MNKEQLKKAFSDAIAWGFVYGPALSAQDFNELRDKKAEQLVELFSSKTSYKNVTYCHECENHVSESCGSGCGVNAGYNP